MSARPTGVSPRLTPAEINRRLWQQDASLWSLDAAAAVPLGWLDSVAWSTQRAPALSAWAQAQSARYIVLLGMGGSSLAAGVFADLHTAALESGSDRRAATPQLLVLDSTAPGAVLEVSAAMVADALFIVASKSGTTIETVALLDYFYAQVAQMTPQPGLRFVAITDPDSWLQRHAQQNGFGRVFINPADIGGRYSALSYFGLVPAALLGIDLPDLLNRAARFVAECRADTVAANPGLALGYLLGDAWQRGQDRIGLQLSPCLQRLGLWIEQMVAESTGKSGKGLLPLLDAEVSAQLHDRESCVVLQITYGDAQRDGGPAALSWQLANVGDLAAEFFRWEFATAVAAVYMQVNPFDQPDVAAAKQATQLFITQQHHHLDLRTHSTPDWSLQTAAALDAPPPEPVESAAATLEQFLAAVKPTDYVAVMAYLPETRAVSAALRAVQCAVAGWAGLAVTLGYAPRCLHSTGQLHKGGRRCGHFLQIVEAAAVDVAIPTQAYTFGELLRAQADGDFSTLQHTGRPLLRVLLNGDRLESLASLRRQVEALRTPAPVSQ